MTLRTPEPCLHERDVLDLVAVGQWPARADAALRTHVTTCASCTEVAAVAVAVREWDEAGPAVHVPDASVVWFRAQMRAREEALRKASRPVLVAQLAAVVVVLAAVAWVGPGWSWLTSSWPDWSPSVPTFSVDIQAWWPELPTRESLESWGVFGWAILAAGVAWLIAGSIALALASRD